MKGGMAWRWVVVLAVVTVLVAFPSPRSSARSPAFPSASVSPYFTSGVTVAQTSSEYGAFNAALILWHNSTSLNQSNPHNFPANMTLPPTGSTFTATLSVSAGVNLAVIQVYQGATVLLNLTVVGQVTVNVVAGTTALSVKAEQLFQQTGAAVPLGTYTVWVNVTEAASLSTTGAAIWSQNPLNFTLPYSISAPFYYRLNSTMLFIPFPAGVSVNYTSLSVTNSTSIQGSYGGVYAYNATIAPGKSLTLTALFAPYPITSGPAVIISMSKPALEAGSTTTYSSTGNWSNPYNLPYEGIYVLTTGFKYTIDPGSVTLTQNSHPVGASTYAVGNNNTVVIVPGTLLIGKGQGVLFQLTFSSIAAPPQASLIGGGGYVLLPLAGFPLTVREVVLGGMVASAIALLWAVAAYAETWKRFVVHGLNDRVDPRLTRAAVDLSAITIALFALWLGMTV